MALISFVVYGVILLTIILIVVLLSLKNKDFSNVSSFYSKEETMKILDINEGALKNMLTEGMLSTYEKNEKVLFKKEDIDEIANKKI